MLGELKALHRAELQPLLGEPMGATEEELLQLEARLGIQLPADYRELLRWMGNDWQGVLVGSDCFINHVERNAAWLVELLRENNVNFELPANFVVVFSHQGYQAAWFECPATMPDPPVWCFCEGTTNEVGRVASVTAFFEEQFRGLIPAVKRLHSQRDVDHGDRGGGSPE
jgi:hypothetical protein